MKTSEILWQDSQHQALIGLLDKLEHTPDIHIGYIDQLIDYATTHFSLEELYMDAHGYPNSKEHKEEHRRFEQKLEELRQSGTILGHGLHNNEFRKSIAQFLRNWLMSHIFGIDKDLEAYLLKTNIEKVI